MKCVNKLALAALALLPVIANGQLTPQAVEPSQINIPARPRGPVIDGAFTIAGAVGVEDAVDGGLEAFFFAGAADPVTGAFNDALMNGEPDVLYVDFADIFTGNDANPIESVELLESLGVDPTTGRFILRLTIGTVSTGPDDEFDSVDVDTDGDGIFDATDGVADACFGQNPPFLAFAIDLDGDGDATNDPVSLATTVGLFIGAGAGGTPVAFDPAAGPVTLLTADWTLLGEDGELADIDFDGVGDGPFDLLGPGIVTPVWDGNVGVGFFPDGDITTTLEFNTGTVKTNSLVLEYLSDIEDEFGDVPVDILLGDVNLDGEVNLFDVSPFVALLTTGTFQAEGDIDQDGDVDLFDVSPFVALLTGG